MSFNSLSKRDFVSIKIASFALEIKNQDASAKVNRLKPLFEPRNTKKRIEISFNQEKSSILPRIHEDPCADRLIRRYKR